MPSDQPRRRSTSALTNAGELLQTLKPAAFAAVLCVGNDEYRNQGEISTAIGCNQSTVSVHLTSLSELPIPLVQKQGHPYVVTEAGKAVVELVDGMATRLGVDLLAIDWTDPDKKETVEALFAPLYNSRSAVPFFILWSLGVRSGGVDLLKGTQPVGFQTLVDDVEALQQDRNLSVTTAQVRQTLNDRFIPSDVVNFDGDDCTLTEKGREHARLIDRLAELLEEYSVDEEEQETANGSSVALDTIRSDETPNPTDALATGSPAQQATPHPFRGSVQRTTDDLAVDTDHSPLSLIPAFCLTHPENANGETNAENHLTPVLPLMPMTAGELAAAATRLTTSYEEDTPLDLCWTVRTDDGLTPVASQFGTDHTAYEDS